MKSFCLLLACLLVAVAHGASIGRFSKSERLPEEVLEEHEDFNIVRYAATKWVCTTMKADISQMDGPGQSPDSIMFHKLFGYIDGQNSDSMKIDMTSPVTTLRKPVATQPQMEEMEMCFWTGSPWQDKALPTPSNSDVYLQERPLMEVFVRRFGGWAETRKEWMEHKEALEQSLEGRTDVEDEPEVGFYTVGYDSPFQIFNRRNEVWITRKHNPNTKEKASLREQYLETPTFAIMLQNEDYELREYPATKWACTKMNDIDPTSDPMNGWQIEFDSNPFAAMQSGQWEEQPSSKMFSKLFAYIAGFNAENVQVEMTSPVSHLHNPSNSKRETQEMCFWLGFKWQKSPPEPLGKDVYIQERPLTRVYVRKFGGFALSYDDFYMHYQALKADLAGKSFDSQEGRFYQISYDSPFVIKDRHNEVWIHEKPKTSKLI